MVISRANRRFSRSAASWIGVSGFLISCAMRRATSAQAALRCADCSSVMSSNVTTKPSVRPPDRSAPMRASSVRRPAGGPICISAVRARSGDAAASAAGRRTPAPRRPARGRAPRAGRAPSKSSAARFGSSIRPDASRPITPARHAGQHRLGEAPALVDLAVGVHQFAALRGKLAGHAIERARQPGEFVPGRRLRHAHRQIAAAHPFGGMDQPPDRPGDLVGDHQADQHRRQQHEQCDDREDPGEGDLQPRPVLVQPLVFRHRLLGACMCSRICRIDRPADHQHQRRRRIELHHGAHARAVAGRQHHDVAALRLRGDRPGGGSTPMPANSPAEASTWPVSGS